MAHNLTDTDAFTSPVVVPDGSDSRNTAAEVVAALAQALANRTHYLNLHAALKTAVNTFEDDNTFESDVSIEGLLTELFGIAITNSDAEQPAISVTTAADDDSHAGNKYKLIGQLKIDASGNAVSVYTGTYGAEAQLILCTNAEWSTVDQNWNAENSHASVALLFDTATGFRMSRRAAGAGNWTTWPMTSGSLEVHDLTANHDLTVTHDLTVGHDANVTHNATAETVIGTHAVTVPTPTDADQTLGLNYSDAGWHTHKINLADFEGNSDLYENLFGDGIEGVYKTTILGRGDMTAWPINLGAGCHIGEIRVQHLQSNTIVGGNDQFLLQKKTGLTGARSTIDTTTAASGGGLTQTTTVHTGGDEVVIDNTEYWLRWKVRNTDGTFNTHRIQAIELDVWDPGPRTKVN